MILVDTSIWIDHFRSGDAILQDLVDREAVMLHPFIVGELAVGTLPRRDQSLEDLRDLPQARLASDDDVLRFIDAHRLWGRGIGYVDAHLLASVRLTPEARLWTRDRRLDFAAHSLSLAARFAP